MQLAKLTLRGYQEDMVMRVINEKRGVLAIRMGFGKTAIVLEAIRRLKETNSGFSVLVIAPKRVAENVWSAEITKWEDFEGLSYSVIAGDARLRKLLMGFKVNIQVISRDLVDWYLKENPNVSFDMVVLDELTSFKNYKSKRFKAVRKLCSLTPRVIGMTGTPTSNGFLDLWAQIYLIDGGQRLGKFITKYRDSYFKAHPYKAFTWTILPETKELISSKLVDIMWGLSDESLLDLPEFITVDVPVKHDPEVVAKYKALKEERVFEFVNSDKSFAATSAGGLVNYLLQFSGGAIYSDIADKSILSGAVEQNRPYEIISEAKLDTLSDLVDELIMTGETVLIAYGFQHEKKRIVEKFSGKYRVGMYTDKDVVDRWNNKEYDILIAHPASFGHGLNLQFGGRVIVWYSMTYSFELYEQFCKRLHRPGQAGSVINYRLLSTGMVDEAICKVALASKEADANLLFEIINVLINEQ